MSEKVYKDLARAQEKIQADQFAEALELLGKLRSDDDLNSYERAQVWNLYGFVYHAQEKYPQAIDAFEKLLREEDLDEALRANTLYSVAVLYYTTEQWRQVVDTMKRWFALDQGARPQAHDLLADAHYQLEEYREAIPQIRKAMELKRAAGEKVEERSYLLLRSAHAELEEYERAAAVLEELIGQYPDGNYWMQLAGTYGQAGDEKKQLSVLELAYLQGYLDSQPDLLSLAGLLLRNDLPYRAGKVLEKGLEDGTLEPTLENWRLLSQAWALAREDRKAIPALTRAAKLSKDGELDLLLAQSYINIEEWEPAAESARTAIRKGGLARPDQANVMLGQILFSLDAFEEAREAFERAQPDSRSRKLAAQWLTYIDGELDRRAKLRAALQE